MIPKIKNLRLFSLLFMILFIFQSCGVYHKNSITLEEAVKQEGKVKILTTNQRTIKYKKITSTDGQFYGNKMKGGKWIQTPLNQEEIMRIRLKNKKASTWMTLLSIGIPVTTLVILFATADFGIGCIWCGGY